MFVKYNHASDVPEDEYLSNEEVLELHSFLVDQANYILSKTQNAMNELTQNQAIEPDELDVALSESNRELSLRFADRERRMLQKIQFTISRIAEGEYGSCEECGEPIGFRRLRSRPVATMCIDCKTAEEQLERKSR